MKDTGIIANIYQLNSLTISPEKGGQNYS